jgi:hypothetical protein
MCQLPSNIKLWIDGPSANNMINGAPLIYILLTFKFLN